MATILPELKGFLQDKTITSTLFESCRVTLFFNDDSQVTFHATNENDPSNFNTNLKIMVQKNSEYNL